MCEKIRRKTYNYLIGYEIKCINTNKLPSYRDVLNLFMYKHQSLKLTIRDSSSRVIDDTNAVWASLLIQTNRPQHSIRKLENLYSQYIKLKKHRSKAKTSKTQQKNVEQFCQRLDKLFDIADRAAVKNLPEGLQQFLTKCRGGERKVHSPEIYVSPEEISENQSVMEQEIPNEENENNTGEIGLQLSQHSPVNISEKNKINILTPELVSALDRTKTNNRNAMDIISAVINSLGLDIDKYNLSSSAIRNARISKREEIVDTIKKKKISMNLS